MRFVSSDVTRDSNDLDGLFRLYHRELTRFAYGRLHDREAAADVVQDAFLRYLSADALKPDAPLSPRFFLRRIVSNLTIDMMRRARRRGKMMPIDDVAAELADPMPGAERALTARQEYAILRRALDELQPRCRSALLLNRVEGKTHAQIALALGVSPSMVSKYIMAALVHCMKRMMDQNLRLPA